MTSKNNLHKVYIVGAGPGNPDMLTVKAHKLITNWAEIIVHDKLISPEILQLIPQSVERIFAGKEPQNHIMKQEEINDVLVAKAKQGKKVLRLKGGDPFIFGRGGEEAEFIKQHGLQFEFVPGITTANGAAAENAIPITYRGKAEGVVMVTGHNYKDEYGNDCQPNLDYKFLASTNYTIVIYMGVKNIGIIAQNLISNGKSQETPCYIIHQATNNDSKKLVCNLSDISEKIAENNISNPAIIYIGDVVNISQELSQ